MATHDIKNARIGRVGHASQDSSVEEPSVGRRKGVRSIGVSQSECGRTSTERSRGGILQIKCQIFQISLILFEGDGVTFNIIARVIKINRQGNIFVTCNWVSNIISISKSSCNQSTAFVPFPFKGLDRTGAVCLSGQSNRSSTMAELRSHDSSNGSSIDVEIMYRGVSVITACIRDLAIEFVNKSVGQQGKAVNREGVSGARGANNELAITSPLVLHFHIVVRGSLGGEGDNVMLTCALRSNNVNRHVGGDSQHNRVGSNIGRLVGSNDTMNEVRSYRIASDRKRRARGVSGITIDIPTTGQHCLTS